MTRITTLFLICASLLLAMPSVSNAQRVTLEDVLTITGKGFGTILKDNAVMGYYFLYETGKSSFTDLNYKIRIYDQNMNMLHENDFTGSRRLYVAEVQYLANKIYIKFGNKGEGPGSIKKGCFVKIIHANGETEDLDLEEEYAELYYLNHFSFTPPKQTIIPFDNGDYLITTQSRNAVSVVDYHIRYFTNGNTTAKWEVTNENSKTRSNAVKFLLKNDSIIYFSVNIAKVSNMELFLLAIDIRTGNIIFKTQLYESGGPEVLESTLDADGNISLYGMWSKGKFIPILYMFKVKVDKTGAIVEKKEIEWKIIEYAIRQRLDDKQSKKGKFAFILREMIYTSNGTLCLVTEEFNETKNNGFKYRNYIITEFDKNLDVLHVNSIKKVPPTIKMKEEDDYNRVGDRMGGIVFLHVQPIDDILNMGIMYNSGTEKRPNLHFTHIIYSNGKPLVEYLPFDPEATSGTALPGKPGYVLLMEYFAEKRKLDTRLEKLNVE